MATTVLRTTGYPPQTFDPSDPGIPPITPQGTTVDSTLAAEIIADGAENGITIVIVGAAGAGPVAPSLVSVNTQLNVVFDGDSLMNTQTFGSLLSPIGHGPVDQVVLGMDPRTTYANVAVAGQTLATMLANAPANVDSLLAAGKTNVLVLRGGTNDLYFGQTALQLQATITAYCAARKAAGWNKVIISTITPRSNAGTPAGFDAARLVVNTWIRANVTTLCDALADIGGDATIGQTGQETNLTYYLPDLVHHTPAGFGVSAKYHRAALAAVVGQGAFIGSVPLGEPTLWVPAAQLRVAGGAPAETLIASLLLTVWNLRHGFTDSLTVMVPIPERWGTFNTELRWINATGAVGNVNLQTQSQPLGVGGNPVAGLVAGNVQIVPVGSAFLISTATMQTAEAADRLDPIKRILITRSGTVGTDTCTDVCSVVGLLLRQAS